MPSTRPLVAAAFSFEKVMGEEGGIFRAMISADLIRISIPVAFPTVSLWLPLSKIP